MKIRTKLILWYTCVLCVSALLIGSVSYYELVIEKREEVLVNKQEEEEGPENGVSDLEEIVLRYGLPSLILGLIGGMWLTHRILTPIQLLTQAAERITDSNLGVSLPRSGNGDELDRLTDVFNAMTERLNRSFLRIREFTLHASHELKTPLTIMMGEAEALLEDTITPSQREYLLSQAEEIRRLTIIVDGLALLTKADAGLVTMSMECVRLDDLVRDAFEDARILAQPGHLQVYLTTCEPVSLQGDRHRLRQLLLNLTDNAVKYNKSRGTVKMALRQTGEVAYELVIANTGEGVSPENQPKVFERFYRGDESHSQNTEGCGLGLSISQWIVHAHGGSIRLESEPDGWTTVTVVFPSQNELHLESGSRSLLGARKHSGVKNGEER